MTKVLRQVLPLPLVLLGLTWYGASIIAQSTVEDEAREAVDREAGYLATRLGARLRNLVEAIEAISANDLIVNGIIDTSEGDKYIDTFFQSLRLLGIGNAHIMLLDYRGRLIAESETGTHINRENAPWLKQVLAGTTVQEIGHHDVTIAVPVMYEGNAEAVLLVELTADDAKAFFTIGGQADEFLVLDGENEVIYSKHSLNTSHSSHDTDAAGKTYEAHVFSDLITAERKVPGFGFLSVLAAVTPEHAYAPARSVGLIFLFAVLASVLAVIASAAFAGASITHPLGKFLATMRGITKSGDLSARIKPDGAREFHNLANSFNQMIGRLAHTTTSRDQVDSILNSMCELLIVTDEAGIVVSANHAAIQTGGYYLDEFKRKFLPDLLGDSEWQTPAIVQKALDDGRSIQSEEVLFRTNFNTWLPVLISLTPLKNPAGDREGFLCVMLDNSELKGREREIREQTLQLYRANEDLEDEIDRRQDMEASLRESESRNRAILEAAADAIITIDVFGKIQNFNSAAEIAFGYEAAEVLGQNVRTLMPEPYRSEHDGYLQKSKATGQASVIGTVREVEACRKDGSLFPIELTISEVPLKGKTLYTGIIRDITERKQINRMKDEFISTVSHELRTPMTSILGSLGLIKGGLAGDLPEKAASMLNMAHRNCDRMVSLLNDILDLEKIESGKMEFQLSPTEIGPVIRDSIETNMLYAQKRGIEIVLTEDAPELSAFADSDRLIQVINNLLSNAIKFSPDNTPIEVHVGQHAGSIRVSVSDRGTGIPLEFQDKIFQRFAQADSSDRRQLGGTGLGLNICRRIIEIHGGAIDYESVVGEGTTFFFDLPPYTETGTNETQTEIRMAAMH